MGLYQFLIIAYLFTFNLIFVKHLSAAKLQSRLSCISDCGRKMNQGSESSDGC